ATRSRPRGSCSQTRRGSRSAAGRSGRATSASCTPGPTSRPRPPPGPRSGPAATRSPASAPPPSPPRRPRSPRPPPTAASGPGPQPYVIVGDGPEREALERLADGLQVEFRGRLSPVDALRTAQSAGAFVLPSVEEAFGVAYIEAMAAGVPAIGTRGEPGPEEI